MYNYVIRYHDRICARAYMGPCFLHLNYGSVKVTIDYR